MTSMRRLFHRNAISCLRSFSNNAKPPPPLLLKLRGDLKNAMKSKDTTRLNVLRSALAQVTNASKTSKPLQTDVQIVALLRKQAAASKAAVQEFQGAKRNDLAKTEAAQVVVLEEYVGGVEMVEGDVIRDAVAEVAKKLELNGERVDQGRLMKGLVGPGGLLEGKAVESVEVAKSVKAFTSLGNKS